MVPKVRFAPNLLQRLIAVCVPRRVPHERQLGAAFPQSCVVEEKMERGALAPLHPHAVPCPAVPCLGVPRLASPRLAENETIRPAGGV